jgi:hypothetical protein
MTSFPKGLGQPPPQQINPTGRLGGGTGDRDLDLALRNPKPRLYHLFF